MDVYKIGAPLTSYRVDVPWCSGSSLFSFAFGPTAPLLPPLSSLVRRVATAWQLTMEHASALQQLSNYSTKNTRASRQIFESGVVLFRNNALDKLGDDSAYCNHSHPRTHLITPFLPGWKFLESLALAAIDVGRIDVAEVSHPIHGILVYGLAFIIHLSPGLLESPSRRIPGVTTSTVPRGYFEGGKRGSEARLTILRTVVRGRPVQCGVLFPSVLQLPFH
jgi:hypothetical protein